jgi:hypothetical protein
LRPIYETPEDLVRESLIGRRLTEMWGVSLHKLPRAYHVDWLIEKDGDVRGFAELKCRSNPRSKYDTFMLSLHKWMHGKQLAAEIAGKFMIIVQWEDGLFYHQQGWCEVKYGVGGRKDRQDAQDIEPVIYIPTYAFKRIT